MANEVHIQRLRGDTAKNDAYRGKDGELVINTDSKSVRIHDGVKTGGYGTIDAAHYATLPTSVPRDLRTGAHVTVGTGRLDGGNVPYSKSSVYAGNIITGGNNGVLAVQERSEGKFYIDATFPEATITKGTVTTGAVGDIDIVQNSVNNYTVNATFPVATASDNNPLTVANAASPGFSAEYARADHVHPVSFEKGTVTNGTTADVSFTRDGDSVKLNMVDPAYAGHSTSQAGSTMLAGNMPEGAIIIERAAGSEPVLKQKVGTTLVSTELSGGVQATYTADAQGTAAIINSVKEGALIVEGTGPINVTADVPVSATTGNTIERKTDGLFNPRSAVVTADSVETASVLPNLAEGAIIIEGPGDVVVETEAKVSSSANNAIIHKGDGIFVDAVRFSDVDPGVGSALPTGSVFLVYEV